MNRRLIQIVAGFALLVGLSAAVLLRVRSNYVLGEPGVKLVNVPIYNEETNLVSNISAFLPEKIGEFTSARIEPVFKIEQQMLPPDTVYGRRIYSGNDFRTMVSIVVMGTDRTSIHKPQYCLTGQGEEIVASEVIQIPISRPQPYDLNVMKLSTRSVRTIKQGESRQSIPVSGIFLYWFVDDQHLTPSHGERMWLMARDLLTTGKLQRWAYVACYSICLPGQEEQLLERMKEFIAASVPEFQTTSGKPAIRETAGGAGEKSAFAKN